MMLSDQQLKPWVEVELLDPHVAWISGFEKENFDLWGRRLWIDKLTAEFSKAKWVSPYFYREWSLWIPSSSLLNFLNNANHS